MLLFGTMVLSLIMTSAVIFIPALSSLFSFEMISFKEYIVALGLALLTIPIVEIVKVFRKRSFEEKHGKNK